MSRFSGAGRRAPARRPLVSYFAAPLAAFSIIDATACGCDTYTEWLALTSTTVEPARLDMARWASAGVILSSVVARYQLFFVFPARSVIGPPTASTPHATKESALDAGSARPPSPANDAPHFAPS